MEANKREKILIYHCAAIGDTVVTIPWLRNICRYHPDAVIDIFNFHPGTSAYHLQLLEGIGNFRNVTFTSIPFSLNIKTWKKRINTFLSFRKEKYDIVYVCNLNGMDKWWVILFRIITNIKKNYIVKMSPSGRRISENIRIQMEESGMPFLLEHSTIRYPLTEKQIKRGSEYFEKLNIPKTKTPFVMGISGKSNSCMYWPMIRYKELLQRIVPKEDLYPVIIGAPSEKEKAEDLLSVCGNGTFVCDLQAPDVIAFMKHTAFYFGNDTGTMHLADSAGIPCVTLFSNKDIYKSWFPEGEHHINIIHQQPCGECRCAVCPKGKPAPCIDSISVDEVESAVRNVLETRKGKNRYDNA